MQKPIIDKIFACAVWNKPFFRTFITFLRGCRASSATNPPKCHSAKQDSFLWSNKKMNVSCKITSKNIPTLSNLFFTPSIITATPHGDEFVTLEDKNILKTKAPSKKKIVTQQLLYLKTVDFFIGYEVRLCFPTFRKRHKHILASALSFLYFKELSFS